MLALDHQSHTSPSASCPRFMVCNPSNRYILCCIAFKNICKLYHSLGLILDLACLTQNCVSAICFNKCRFILLLLLLYGILLYDFGKFHFPSYFDGHLVCLQLLVIRKKGEKHGVVYIQAFLVLSDAATVFHRVLSTYFPANSVQGCLFPKPPVVLSVVYTMLQEVIFQCFHFIDYH